MQEDTRVAVAPPSSSCGADDDQVVGWLRLPIVSLNLMLDQLTTAVVLGLSVLVI